MATIFFPSCKTTNSFKESHELLLRYLKKKVQLHEPINKEEGVILGGCCRTTHQLLQAGDKALVCCNNCAALIEENSAAQIEFVWQLIDKDPDFDFPDYKGEKITVQDCWAAFEKLDLQNTIRSLLKKMNFQVLEQEENFSRTKFHGTMLLGPCPPGNAKLVKKRYVLNGSHMFTPMNDEEKKIFLTKHCKKIKTPRVCTYCKSCTDGINLGGLEGVHILELLFPTEKF